MHLFLLKDFARTHILTKSLTRNTQQWKLILQPFLKANPWQKRLPCAQDFVISGPSLHFFSTLCKNLVWIGGWALDMWWVLDTYYMVLELLMISKPTSWTLVTLPRGSTIWEQGRLELRRKQRSPPVSWYNHNRQAISSRERWAQSSCQNMYQYKHQNANVYRPIAKPKTLPSNKTCSRTSTLLPVFSCVCTWNKLHWLEGKRRIWVQLCLYHHAIG